MARFDANLTLLYTEFDFLDRFAAAANDGFEGVEYLFPYAYPKEELARRLRDSQARQVLFNLPAGNWTGGERGIACDPARIAEFETGVAAALEYAAVLGCSQVNCLAGIVPSGVGGGAARDTFVRNLRYAAIELGRAGVTLLIEPVNTFDIPGFFLSHSAQAFEIIDDVGSENLKLQYDVYHMQRMEGELAATLAANLARIGHVQIADNPGRHEPGTGEINYPYLFEHLDRIGYGGWIGCEYVPAAKTSAGLTWFESARRETVALEGRP